MKATLYKPNSKNTGCLGSFSLSKKTGEPPTLYISLVQQFSWNDSSKKGSFKENAKNPNKSLNIKMTLNEAGEFISSFRTGVPFANVHSSQSGEKTTFSLIPWKKSRKIFTSKGEETHESTAFVFGAKKDGNSFRLAIEAGESELISIICSEFIKQSLSFESAKYSYTPKEIESKTDKQSKNNQSENSDFEDEVPF